MLLVGLVAVAVTAMVGAVELARAVTQAHRARAAADFAALAGARALVRGDGPERACAQARRLAMANGADLAGCAVEGGSVVRVSVRTTGLPGGPPVTVMARAGP